MGTWNAEGYSNSDESPYPAANWVNESTNYSSPQLTTLANATYTSANGLAAIRAWDAYVTKGPAGALDADHLRAPGRQQEPEGREVSGEWLREHDGLELLVVRSALGRHRHDLRRWTTFSGTGRGGRSRDESTSVIGHHRQEETA